MTGRRSFMALAAATLLPAPSWADEPSGRAIVERGEALLWGQTLQGRYEMTITTPRWERTLVLRVWIERPHRSFVRIESPAKEAGIGSLRIGAQMWNYLPAVERTIKIPPSMMLQPWMGSDFTNDDLVKESSVLDDYVHERLEATTFEGQPAYQVRATPKPDAAVVWGSIVFWARRNDFVPLAQQYYDERGKLVRTLNFSDVRVVGGRSVPTRWAMQPADTPGQRTTVILKDAVYDQPIAEDVFSQRHLQRR
ncbi:outer membrane lipoprotein-sorting protein [uncultured Piscinibacter sp.]|uniref:outer membrane lipoprotein-sorting protein n=1 Tax=uncultured Piscinibacter sp. TaxID=1131835 RepID=UPI0026141A5C|nr:outer membrane lipoprotein-sorting protein [uncultured Piscinibacter sp.]